MEKTNMENKKLYEMGPEAIVGWANLELLSLKFSEHSKEDLDRDLVGASLIRYCRMIEAKGKSTEKF